jgi:hypothetical protein
MHYGPDVAMAVVDLEETLRLSRKLDTGFEENRREAIQQRREISQKVARVFDAAQAITDSSARSIFMAEFAKMRSAFALHHASWPIVLIDQSDPGYRKSIQTMRTAYTNFFDWFRRQ